MNRGARAGLWALVLALAILPAALRGDRGSLQPHGTPLQRWLGPIASLAASGQWARVHLALREGRSAAAFARAETALALDPLSSGGWKYFASHLAYDRASIAREPDPVRRLAWIRAALDVAARGEERSSEPRELALLRGFFHAKAATDEELPIEGGPATSWRRAAEAFDRAAGLGHPDAVELARAARDALADSSP